MAEPASSSPRLPPPSPQPCDTDCAFATPLGATADETGNWLWCTHPAQSTRLVHLGRDCPRHQAAPPAAD